MVVHVKDISEGLVEQGIKVVLGSRPGGWQRERQRETRGRAVFFDRLEISGLIATSPYFQDCKHNFNVCIIGKEPEAHPTGKHASSLTMSI